MRAVSNPRPARVVVLLLLAAVLAADGCSRSKYRVQADREAYGTIAERSGDVRWAAPNYSIEPDPRSRYFDRYNPDRSPMPLDDPVSHGYMRVVDGKRGWKHWYDNGQRGELENPSWRDALGTYVETAPDGSLKLDVNSALRLAYIHSPFHQTQLETLYLSALDVTAERFRLSTQFFGGYNLFYDHNGELVPARIAYDQDLGRFKVFPPEAGVETNRVAVGRPFEANPALQISKRFATAGELLVGFANSFVFEFAGGDANFASSLLNFSFIQPVLRGGGRDVALEDLTFQERALLANLRSYGQFRQGFYTQVAIGELGVTGPQRFGPSTTLQSFSGVGGTGGYLGLLQQVQQVRIAEDNLALQLRTRDRLEALYDNKLIDLVQVDQFRQGVESQRSEVLLRQNGLELSLDNYKTGTLGLPPNLPIELDQTLIRPFQLFPREFAPVQESLFALQRSLSTLPEAPNLETLQQALNDCFGFIEPARQLFASADKDIERMEATVPVRESTMNWQNKEQFREDRQRLQARLADLRSGELSFDVAVMKLEALRDNLDDENRAETMDGITAWVGDFLQVIDRLTLVPAQARLEVITVDPIELAADDAFRVALENRLDFMNGRAALVDQWRLIQVNADALQSVLTLVSDGRIRTARNNPLSFRAPTGQFQAGVQFDAPLTRLLERNTYRESLIDYQRSRRDFIQSRDGLHLGLRALLRNLEQLRRNLEIQRRAVTIALRQVDETQLRLTEPRPPALPGQRRTIPPTVSINLINAQASLQRSQNDFLFAWLNYYATRMRLYRELGVMQLDPEGRWIEYPIGGSNSDEPQLEELPPAEDADLPPVVPVGWLEIAGQLDPEQPSSAAVRRAAYSAPLEKVRHSTVSRLPPPPPATN